MTCPVCGRASRTWRTVDSNRCCEDRRLEPLEPSGVSVSYELCGSCGHLHAPEYCAWTAEQFAERIYNEEYERLDPDCVEYRPRLSAEGLNHRFGCDKGLIRHLDYGGGKGRMSEILRNEFGWDSTSVDPYVDQKPLHGRFNLITAFEVFEHAPDPSRLMNDMLAAIDQQALIIFSTALSDGQIDPSLDWWYVAPRNGHINIYSQASLRFLFARFGYTVASLNGCFHLAFRFAPDWAIRGLEAMSSKQGLEEDQSLVRLVGS